MSNVKRWRNISKNFVRKAKINHFEALNDAKKLRMKKMKKLLRLKNTVLQKWHKESKVKLTRSDYNSTKFSTLNKLNFTKFLK